MQAGEDPTVQPVALADVADNPGGGANGNTTWILEALVKAGAKGSRARRSSTTPLAAEEAMQLGEGARSEAVFNRNEPDQFSRRFEAEATVLRIRDGDCVGRRGFYAGRRLNLGTTALLDLGGVKVVVVSIRTQCADPVFLEMMGIDIGKARSVVGQVAWPFPRRVRRVLRPRPGHRGRRAGAVLARSSRASTSSTCRARCFRSTPTSPGPAPRRSEPKAGRR